jgi:hypothetical protein
MKIAKRGDNTGMRVNARMRRDVDENFSKYEGTDVGSVTIAAEVAAYEELGPVTRRMIDGCPMKILAYPIVQDIRKFEEEQRIKLKRPDLTLNLQDPKLDSNIARGLLEKNFELMSKDNPALAEMGLKPLVAKPSVRTARLNRGSARVRRMFR